MIVLIAHGSCSRTLTQLDLQALGDVDDGEVVILTALHVLATNRGKVINKPYNEDNSQARILVGGCGFESQWWQKLCPHELSIKVYLYHHLSVGLVHKIFAHD